MSKSLEKYRKLGLKQSLSRTYRYPLACKELSFILKNAYNELPKNLQSVIFQDTLTAFRLLPEMQANSAISAANLLLQSVEASLPKQKKNQAATEFKHAKVAHKRRYKARQEEDGSAQLPEDVLVHIYRFLDVKSLASVAQVSWSWNSAANDNSLWQLQYATFFGNTENLLKVENQLRGGLILNKRHTHENVANVTRDTVDWREAFRKAYEENTNKLSSSRGYCGHCNEIVWLDNMKCSNNHHGMKEQIQHVSLRQVVKYLMEDDSLSTRLYSDSDSDSDEESASRLWAYSRDIDTDDGRDMKIYDKEKYI